MSEQKRTSPSVINRHQVVERAEAFIRAHTGDPVAVSDLCEVTGVSERTLRNAFGEVCGVSPKQYMLRLRLAQVHAALQRRKVATVTTIATDYGFFELGRFASRYRSMFGERPSDTLRAGQSFAIAG